MPNTSRSRATRATSPHSSVSATGDPTKDNSTSQRVKSSRRLSTTAGQLLEPRHTADDEFPDTRNPKRRKLEIRGPRQQTLDGFLNQEQTLKLRVKTATYTSNVLLTETVNGVQDRTEDGNTSATANGTLEHEMHAHNKQKNSKAQEMKQEDKRTLRSQDDGPRLKSELATYFSNYEDIIFDTPREPELLTVDTTIFITDDASVKAKTNTPSPSKSMKLLGGSPTTVRRSSAAGSTPGPSTATGQQADFDIFDHALRSPIVDRLTDEAFRISHKRAERKEKQMRNIEKEHAMHEKAQLDKLLDGLLGHDWLRVLGITGVTESEARKFESKRRYFIKEVKSLVDKFKEWKDEERRQRLEKEAAIAAEREANAADDEDDDGDVTEVSTSNPPSTDLNASASRQLQQETASAMRVLNAAKAADKELSKSNASLPPMPYRPPSPITSFYSARHMRDSALKRARNSRKQLAFGQLLPEVDEEEFSLPADYLSEDVLRASARERRRRKRESVAQAGTTPA